MWGIGCFLCTSVLSLIFQYPLEGCPVVYLMQIGGSEEVENWCGVLTVFYLAEFYFHILNICWRDARLYS